MPVPLNNNEPGHNSLISIHDVFDFQPVSGDTQMVHGIILIRAG